jgi:hypothetical protein
MNELSEPSISSFASRSFDLSSGPLTRIMINKNTSWVDFVLVQHHAITDKVAIKSFMQKVQGEYQQCLANGCELVRNSSAPEVPDYTIWAQWKQDRRLSVSMQDQHATYWRTHLLDPPSPPFQLSGHGPRQYAGHSQSISLSKAPGLTGSMELYVALVGLAIAKVQGSQDVIVGIPHIDRTEPGTEDLLGCFLDRLPVRMKISPEDSNNLEGLIGGVKILIQNALVHSIPLKDIRKITGQEEPFQVMVLYNRREDDIANAIQIPGVGVESGIVKTSGAKFPLLVEFTEEEGCTACDFEYMDDLVSSKTVSAIAQTMLEVLSDTF